MSREQFLVEKKEQEDHFTCKNCKRLVLKPETGTTQRNHCPSCLWSLHLDIKTGDRLSTCRGLMEPVSIWVKPSDEWSLIHYCRECGLVRANRIAGDDNEVLLLSLALKPLVLPAFPLQNVTLRKS